MTPSLAGAAAQNVPPAQVGPSPPSQPRPPALNIPRNRSSGHLLSQRSSNAILRGDASEPRGRMSVDGDSFSDNTYENLTRSPMLPPERETAQGLRRIRQQHTQAPSRNASSPNLQALSSPPSPISRKSSFTLTPIATAPAAALGEDLTRFPSESLHSFSFTHQSSDLHARQNVLRRSIDFMRDRTAWASSSPRIATAQARLAGDDEVLSVIELLQQANVMPPNALSHGLGLDAGPLTGPAHLSHENVFEQSFFPSEQESESPTELGSSDMTAARNEAFVGGKTMIAGKKDTSTKGETNHHRRETTVTATLPKIDMQQAADSGTFSAPHRPQRALLKRTYTDVAGYSLQHRLTEAMTRPYHARQPAAPAAPHLPVRAGTAVERAPHGDRNRNAQAQAIFTTDCKSPWTITAANDLACLVFGVTRAEVRKLGIMEVIQEDHRKWLEDKLTNPESGSALIQSKLQSRSSAGKTGTGSGTSSMGNGVTAKLLAKPPVRQTYRSRRSKTEDGTRSPGKDSHYASSRSRGVLLCGDVVPVRKMNGATGSASLWVKEKGDNLIWVLEEIAEDVVILTVDEIGSIIRGKGDIEAIFGLDRVRNGMDVHKLIPGWPKLAGTNTGAVDYDAISRLRNFTARTINSINVPVTLDQSPHESQFRISSFPHIAGILVVNPSTMQVSSSNTVFSAALFGRADPDGLPITDLIPSFSAILQVIIDEDQAELVDGIVIPEHSFRRARALLALREGSAEAAALFLRPSGLPARHRDGAEIMIDVQMRVVKSDRDPVRNDNIIDEDEAYTSPSSEVVYALWITYSRQLHAANQGIGPVTSLPSRPSTPPTQPAPEFAVDDSAPSPVVVGEIMASVDDDPRISLLTQQLEEEAKAGQTPTSATDGEPFEHPSPELIEANVTVIKKKKIEDFAIIEEMGQGAYGQVKLARYRKAGAKKMVIKYVTKRRILVDTWHRDRRLGTVPLEIHVLDYLRRDGLQHPNIVEMEDFFEDDINYYIEMKPHGSPGVDLFDYIELRIDMEEPECRQIFRQVAEAIRHLHVTAKVVHRDIKDENVILDGEGRVKLADFGSAAYIKSGPFDVFVGTIDYAAPEVLRGLPYGGREQDVWALGILLYTIVYKENPFYSIDEITDHDLRVPYVTSEDCIDLIRKMLDRNVERRIGIQAVLEHPWTTFIDPEEDKKDDKGSKDADAKA